MYLENSGIDKYRFDINAEKKEEINKIISKFIEWNRKASYNGVKLSKDMGSLIIDLYYEDGGKWVSSSSQWNFRFFSKSEKVHQIIIAIDKESLKDKSVYKLIPNEIYIGWDSAIYLLNSLDDKNIDKAIKNRAYKRVIEKEFE